MPEVDVVARNRAEAVRELEARLEGRPAEEQVDLRNELAATLGASDAPRARDQANVALQQARAIGYARGQAAAMQALGFAEWGCGRLDAALGWADEALERFVELEDRKSVARTHLVRSMVFQHQSRTGAALEALTAALANSEACDDRQGQAIALDGIGLLYANHGDYDRALAYRHQCAAIHEEVGDQYRLAIAWNNIGETHLKRGEYTEALTQLKRARDRLESLEPSGYPIAGTHCALGKAYFALGQRAAALAHWERALGLRRGAGDERGIVESCCALGEFLLEDGQIEPAEALLTEATQSAHRIGLPAEESLACLALARLYERGDEPAEALRYQRRATELQATLAESHRRRCLDEMEARYESEKREHEAEVRHLREVKLAGEIERRRLAERSFLQSQRLESLGVLAGGVANDFNNLMHTVLGNLDLCVHRAPADSTTEYVRQAREAARRAAEIARVMLEYTGRGRHRLLTGCLADAVRNAETLLRGIGPADLELRIDIAPDLPRVRIDEGQVHQVLVNLLRNAIEANAREVVLGLYAREIRDDDHAWWEHTGRPLPPGRTVVLAFRDDGDGIAPAEQGKVFDPFYSTKFVGRGLGLAAVIGIVRGHAAGLRLESEPGAGSTFELAFPATDS